MLGFPHWNMQHLQCSSKSRHKYLERANQGIDESQSWVMSNISRLRTWKRLRDGRTGTGGNAAGTCLSVRAAKDEEERERERGSRSPYIALVPRKLPNLARNCSKWSRKIFSNGHSRVGVPFYPPPLPPPQAACVPAPKAAIACSATDNGVLKEEKSGKGGSRSVFLLAFHLRSPHLNSSVPSFPVDACW